MFNPSDISHLADFADLRAEALQAGSRAFITLRPKFPSMQSLMSISGRDRMSRSPLRPLLKRSAKRWSQRPMSRTSDRFSRASPLNPSPPSTLCHVNSRIRIQIPAPGRGTEAKKGFAGSHTSDARAAYIFPPFDDVRNSEYAYRRRLDIELAKHCYFCFQDRFYLVPEIAVLIRATRLAAEVRRIEPFTILHHDGVEYQPVTGTVLEIMAELLVQILRQQAILCSDAC